MYASVQIEMSFLEQKLFFSEIAVEDIDILVVEVTGG